MLLLFYIDGYSKRSLSKSTNKSYITKHSIKDSVPLDDRKYRIMYRGYLTEYFMIVHDDTAAVSHSEHVYTDMSGGQDVHATECIVYANTGPSIAPIYDPCIVPTLPVSVDTFRHHITNCHLNDDNQFSDQYQVIRSDSL